MRAPYRGRFAPSPTGPLHFGSLVAAVGSFLRARHCGGDWLVRMEDLDPPREVPGAAEEILRALAALGLDWDGEVAVQSRRTARYERALERLAAGGWTYRCNCSRAELRRKGRGGALGPIYPGTCRRSPPAATTAAAVRVKTGDDVIAFHDQIQGPYAQNLAREVGDFVVHRADSLFAYQLAVVVDDAAQGVTEVVRGTDLLDSTPRQVHLQRLLDLPTPGYCHLPIAVDAAGAKLSKQTGAAPVDSERPTPALRAALAFLGQPSPPPRLSDPGALLRWAVGRWQPGSVPRRLTITFP